MNKPKKTLYVMIGAPGSGKSTWVQKHMGSFEGKVSWVSRDKIRFAITREDEDYFAHENEVYDEFIRQIKDDLKIYDVVIADATHITVGSRLKLFKALGNSLKDVKVIAMVIKADFETIKKQNDMREGRSRVPLSSLRRMYSCFMMPFLDEEPFDEIWIYEGYKYTILSNEDGD